MTDTEGKIMDRFQSGQVLDNVGADAPPAKAQEQVSEPTPEPTQEQAQAQTCQHSTRSAAEPAPSGPPPFLQVCNLHKEYQHNGNQINVLRGINFTLQHGEMVSIEGASGVGKSTLIQVLGTLDFPSSGTVLFNGHDVFKLKPGDLARFRNDTIGFMFQFHHLLPEFTALENVMMPALIKRTGRAAAEKAAWEMLEAVGLSNRGTHKPGEMSGGEQQRVALARALALKPRLLLADEPTGNLDPGTGEGIHQVLFNVNRSHNIAVMVVTHSQTLAQRMPRRMRIVDGMLVEYGKTTSPCCIEESSNNPNAGTEQGSSRTTDAPRLWGYTAQTTGVMGSTAQTHNSASSGLPEGSPLSGDRHD